MAGPPTSLRHDPYALADWLLGLPEDARDAAEREALASVGHTSLERWKEHHAFGVALGRPLEEFPRGTYAFYFCSEEPLPDHERLAEELAPVDLEALAEEAGLDPDDVDAMDDEELASAVAEQLGEARVDGGGFHKHAEAPSLFELLRRMVARSDLGMDAEPSGLDALWRDEKLPPELAHLRPVRDLRLRRLMTQLDGDAWQMERTHDYEEDAQYHGILDRRPGWRFVCGWASAPPNEAGGACILCLPDDEPDADAD